MTKWGAYHRDAMRISLTAIYIYITRHTYIYIYTYVYDVDYRKIWDVVYKVNNMIMVFRCVRKFGMFLQILSLDGGNYSML